MVRGGVEGRLRGRRAGSTSGAEPLNRTARLHGRWLCGRTAGQAAYVAPGSNGAIVLQAGRTPAALATRLYPASAFTIAM